jgi:hypothetical protein
MRYKKEHIRRKVEAVLSRLIINEQLKAKDWEIENITLAVTKLILKIQKQLFSRKK